MGTLLRARWSPRLARMLPAGLLAILCALLLPGLAQGAATYQVLYSFPLSPPPSPELPPEPVIPSGLLLRGADGNFYGTTWYGGGSDQGAVFKLTPSGTFTPLHSFTGETDGVYPAPTAGLILGSDGNFYGTTYRGVMTDGLGTVFRLTPAGGLTTLHAFSVAAADGDGPQASLVQDSVGNLYGTTNDGGTIAGGNPGYGTVFKLTLTIPEVYTFSTIYTFGGADGANPQGNLVQKLDGSGNPLYLYGTTYSGGVSSYGTVFKLTLSPTVSFTTLYPFTGGTDGANPQGNLVLELDGSGNPLYLYGTTYSGGDSNLGTVFRLTLTGTPTLTTLHAFNGTDGANPSAGLIRGADGNLYGTTLGECTYGDAACTSTSAGKYGTVFRLATDGSGFTTLHTFTGTNGANPQTGLTQDAAGNFYGTTSYGGSTAGGVVFALLVVNPLTVTVTGPQGAAVTAATSTPPWTGTPCTGTCTQSFPETATVTLTATSVTGYGFRWGGDCSGTESACTLDMTTARSVTATWTSLLTVAKAGTGTGTVTSSPSGITCGGTCSLEFNYNTPVALTAAAAAGSAFTGWSGSGVSCPGTGPCTVTMNQARTVTATFQQDGTPPTVIHSAVMSWRVTTPQTAIPITATITDNIAVQRAILYYRTTGATTYTTVTLTAPGPTFNWTIPAGAVTTTGVQYYLEARDTANNPTRLPISAPTTPYSVVVAGTTVFTDDPLIAGTTPIKLVHFTELLTAINAVRAKAPYNLPAFTWTGTAPAASGAVRASHLADLRTALTAPALNAAYKGKYGKDITFGEAITAGVVIKASHLSELRMYVRALE